MDNASLGAESVANGPMTLAPPSFEGMGWLVVINLALMTAFFVVATMFAIDAGRAAWRNRENDLPNQPVWIWRVAGLAFAAGIAIRCAGGALVLWNWNPQQPANTAWYLTLQRFLDPIALLFGVAGLALLYLSARGMVEQLRKRPFPIDMWASIPMLRRPLYILICSLVAAIGVVSTR